MESDKRQGSAAEDADRDRVAAIDDDRADWGQFLLAHRERLKRMVALRLDQRLLGRIDPSDVIQEAFLEATERQADYVRQPEPMPRFLWLRFLTLQRLQLIHRQQFGTRSRGGANEISIHGKAFPGASSAGLAAQLLGRDTRPSEVALRAERKRRLHEGLDRMDPIDREVLVLRHFEQLSNGECARVMGISESAATKRYLRALERLKDLLSVRPGGHRESWP